MNPHRVHYPSIEIDFAGEKRTLQIDINALCKLEDKFDGNFPAHALLTIAARGSVKYIVALVHVAMLRHHPEETEQSTIALIDRVGYEGLLEQLVRMMDDAPAAKTKRGKKRGDQQAA